jgi:very-short-patch-repair endonuclease
MTVWTYRELRRAGVGRTEVERMMIDGRLLRVRVGWYASTDTHASVLAAVRAGGSMSCSAALQKHGIWVVRGDLHVRLEPRSRRYSSSAVVHRMRGSATGGIDDLPTALRMAVVCLSPELAVCAIDSALNNRRFTRPQLASLLETPRGRRLLALADGRSESGLETLARLRLRAHRLKVHVQVEIDEIGRVDLMIGNRLVIELDGDEWHSTPGQREKDRRRDSALTARGYLVMRAGFTRIMNDCDAFVQEVLAVVRRREHLWRYLHNGGSGGPSSPSRR